MRRSLTKRRVAACVLAGVAVICAVVWGMAASSAWFSGSAAHSLDPQDGLLGEDVPIASVADKFQQESSDKFADVMHIENGAGQKMSLADVPATDYSGFIFKPQGAESGSGDISSVLDELVQAGTVRALAGGMFAVDSLDTLASLFEADQLQFIEPNFTLRLLDDEESSLTSATSDAGADYADAAADALAGGFDIDALAEQDRLGAASTPTDDAAASTQAEDGQSKGSSLHESDDLLAQGGTSANPAPEWPPNDQQYVAGKLWNLDMLKVQGAWSAGLDGDVFVYNNKPVRADEQGNAEPIKVAIIDTGLFGTGKSDTVQHEDLNYDKVVPGHNFISDVEGEAPDAHGHGTFVAGIIAGIPNNSVGVAGLMPEVTLVPEKVFDTGSASTEDVISAIYHAVDTMGVDVINMSLGGEYNEYSLEVACNHAVQEDVLVVASAGNDGVSTPNYPAAYNSVVGVASVNSSKVRSSWSQYGRSVFVTAPGESITSTYREGADSYYTASGTSFSGPEVAALAAMCKSVYPDMTQDIFKQFLIDTSTDLGSKGYDDYYGYGLVDFTAMAQMVLESQTLPWYHLSFNLVDESGNQVSDATVKLTAAEDITWDSNNEPGVDPYPAGSLSLGQEVAPNASGVFDVHRGNYDYEITSNGHYTVTGTLKTYAENQVTDITLPTAYETKVSVTDFAGNDVSGAALTITSSLGRVETPKSSDGKVSVYDLASGTYGYSVVAGGYQASEGSFTVQRSAKEVSVKLYRASDLAKVTFSFADEDNTPIVKNVGLAVYDTAGDTTMKASSDADGEYYLLPKGSSFRATATKAGYESVSTDFTVTEDIQVVSITLIKAQIVITFNVVDENGRTLTSSKVKVADANGSPVDPQNDNPKSFNLVEGDYTYEASAAGYSPKSGSFTVTQSSITRTVVLEALPHTVKFTVIDSDTRQPVDGAYVKVSDAGVLRALPEDKPLTWVLTPGDYYYIAYAEGYEAVQRDFSVGDDNLDIEVELTKAASSEVAYAGGTGTADDPYLIATEGQLRYLAKQTEIVRMTRTDAPTNKKGAVTGYYKLVNDIELTDGEWLPIGNSEFSSNTVAFSGTFDGNGCTVSGVSINEPTYDNMGFFGYVQDATIKNLTVEGEVVGRSYVGGIVGGIFYQNDTYTTSSNTGPTHVENCGSNVNVSGGYAVGGIAGSPHGAIDSGSPHSYATGISISGCYNTGAVSSMANARSSRAGGIVGSAQTVSISSCYNTGDVAAQYTAGGVAGYVGYGSTVANCYNAGKVEVFLFGTGYDKAGCVVGQVYTSTLSDSFFLNRDDNTRNDVRGEIDSTSKQINCSGYDYEGMYRSDTFLSTLNTDTVNAASIDSFVFGREFPLLKWQVASDALLAAMPHVIVQPVGNTAQRAYRAGAAAEPLTAQVDEVARGSVTWAWYRSPESNGSGASPIEGATGAGYVATYTPPTSDSDVGVSYYYCVFSNTASDEQGRTDVASKKTGSASIYVRSTTDARAPSIDKLNPSQTRDINTVLTAKQGTDLRLSVVASRPDNGTLTYQWYRSDTGAGTGTALEGATGTSYDVPTGSITTTYFYVEVTNTTEPGNYAVTTSDWISVDIVPYTIENLSELKDFRDTVNGGASFEGQIVTLLSDIAITDADWEPIGTRSNPFSGTFMGGAGSAGSTPGSIFTHSITGLQIDGDKHDNAYLGLFGYVQGGSIYDVQVGGSITGADNYATGLLVGTTSSTYTSGVTVEVANCASLPGSSVEGKYELGGLIGASSALVVDCANHADVNARAYEPTAAERTMSDNAKAVGGVVGWSSSGLVSGCYNTGTISCDANTAGKVCANRVGGVAGHSNYYSGIASCFNSGNLQLASVADTHVGNSGAVVYAGSVAGYVAGGTANLHYLENTYSRGTDGSSNENRADYHSEQFMKTQFFVDMMNTGSGAYSYCQFEKSNNGVPHLIWEADTTSGDEKRSAEPWISDITSEDFPSITSTWKGAYYQDGMVNPIYVLVESPDGGALTYVWQVRDVPAQDASIGEDDGWTDMGASQAVPTDGECAGKAVFTMDVSQKLEAKQYRILVTNKIDGGTEQEPMQATIPPITLEVRDKAEGLYLKDGHADSKLNSADNPWVIDTSRRLQALSDVVNAAVYIPGIPERSMRDSETNTRQYIELTADIDLTGIDWAPIGTPDQYHAGDFQGVFDGAGHTVSGLSITPASAKSTDYQGLFGGTYAAIVRNLEVKGSIDMGSSAAWSTGGVSGYAYGTLFENIVNRVDVKGYSKVGGLVGYAGSSRFVDCENIASVGPGASTATEVGGIAGYYFGSVDGGGFYTCFNQGTVKGSLYYGAYRTGALVGNSELAGGVPMHWCYYLKGCASLTDAGYADPTGVSYGASAPAVDEEGTCQAIDDVNSPQTAWMLNTAGGTAASSGRWSNYMRADIGDETPHVHLVRGDATTQYRVDTTSLAADISATLEYASPGDAVGVTWASKPGFTVTSVGWKVAGAEDGTAQVLGTSSAQGTEVTFTMPEADVEFVVAYTQDADYAYSVAHTVSYQGGNTWDDASCVVSARLRSAEAGAPALETAKAGDNLVVTVELDSAYQIKGAAIDARYGTDVALKREDGVTYSFTMPAEDVTFALTVEDAGSPADRKAASEPVEKAATHIGYEGQDEQTYQSANLVYQTLVFSGSYFGSENPYMTYELEKNVRPGLYQQSYSFTDENGVSSLHTFTGIDLASLIERIGSNKAPSPDAAVTIEMADGNRVVFTYDQLTSLTYNAYDQTGQPIARGLPVLLFFGEDGKPNTDGAMGVVFGQTVPFARSLDGQSLDADALSAQAGLGLSSSLVLNDVVRIAVGDDINYSQHVYAPFNDMDNVGGAFGQTELTLRLFRGGAEDGKLMDTKTISLLDIEKLARDDRAGIQRGTYTTVLYDDAADDPSGPYSDYYEGYDLMSVFKAAGVPSDESLIDATTVQFYQSGNYGLENSWKTALVSMRYLAGNGAGGTGDYSNNFMEYRDNEAEDEYAPGQGTITGLRPMIAYGKNTLPLVWYSGSEGYSQYAYNYRGPMMAFLPQNMQETTGAEFVGTQTATACFLGLIDVYLPEDIDYIETAALASAIAAAQADLDATKVSANGSDVPASDKWVTSAQSQALANAISSAQAVLQDASSTQGQIDAAKASVEQAQAAFDAAKKSGTKGSGQGSAQTTVKSTSMYRVYNPYSGEHFYTSSSEERDHLRRVGWNYEGVGWYAPSQSATPVYRLYNPNAGDHHYTPSTDERDYLKSVGWSYEGIGWYSDDAKGVAVLRAYNPNAYSMGMSGAHHYTTSASERDYLVSVGWHGEGVGWYGMASSSTLKAASAGW